MKLHASTFLHTLALCSYAAARSHEDTEVPLHRRPFVQDSAEELERKWSFEVSLFWFLPRAYLTCSSRAPFHHPIFPTYYISSRAESGRSTPLNSCLRQMLMR